jgi:hypothetical protein
VGHGRLRVTDRKPDIRAAQTGVFDLDILISNRMFIDVCISCVAETGIKSRNVEKRINASLSGPIRAAQTGVFDPDIRVANRWFIRLYKPVRGSGF